MAETVYVRASRAAIVYAASKIPSAAMGDEGARAAAEAMMVRCGMALLGRIKKAFVVKSRGGTDEAGERWAPLSPKTIAYSRRHPRLPKPDVRAGFRPSYALTKRQRDRWWEVYGQQLARFRGDKGRAAKVAWFVLKGEGAQTLLMKYGGTQVDILRDTGLLLNSLSPGIASGPVTSAAKYGGLTNQVFRVGRGEVVVGTNRKGAAAHHKGIPGRLPQRRLWPPPDRWPGTWWVDIREQAVQGLADIALDILRRASG